MSSDFTPTARRLGLVSAAATVVLLIAYAVTLSVVYALDILGWDVFFALAMLFAAPVFGGSRLAAWIRGTMIASGVLALAGLFHRAEPTTSAE